MAELQDSHMNYRTHKHKHKQIPLIHDKKNLKRKQGSDNQADAIHFNHRVHEKMTTSEVQQIYVKASTKTKAENVVSSLDVGTEDGGSIRLNQSCGIHVNDMDHEHGKKFPGSEVQQFEVKKSKKKIKKKRSGNVDSGLDVGTGDGGSVRVNQSHGIHVNDMDHESGQKITGSQVQEIEVKEPKRKKKEKRSENVQFGLDVGTEDGGDVWKNKKRVDGCGNGAGGVGGDDGYVEWDTKEVEGEQAVENGREGDEDGASSSGRFTISMAVAGSIVDNAQSCALASRLAGQIARAAAIFRIDEIVVFDDGEEGSRVPKWSEDASETSGRFLTRILKYMETPQYLRQTLIPKHSSLQFAGGLPPLDVPHQARKHEWIPYREGAVTIKPAPPGGGSCVNVGLYEDVVVRQKLEPGTRVTVKMGDTRPQSGKVRILGVVAKSEPRSKGRYWGYTVRQASCLSTVFSECPFPEGYDYIIGTSEHGDKVRSAELTLPKFKHIMIVFGGVAGLEESKELDKSIKVQDVRHLFNIYLNTCPGQGVAQFALRKQF